MKNKLFILIVSLFLVCKYGFAQKFEIGPQAGINFAYLINDKDFNGKLFKMTFNGGIYSSFKITEWFSIRPEIHYIGKVKNYRQLYKSNFLAKLDSLIIGIGNNINNFIPDSINLDSLLLEVKKFANDTVYHHSRIKASLSYIEVPIIFCFNYKSFSFGIGPYVSILTGGLTTTELKEDIPLLSAFPGLIEEAQKNLNSQLGGLQIFNIKSLIAMEYPGYYSPKISESTNISNYNIIDYGFIASLGFKVENDLTINLRYSYGFSEIHKILNNDNNKHQSFQINISYNLKKILNKPPKY